MGNIRVGLGFDSHRIEAGGPMKLGGISVDCDAHFVGHSDGDVLLHAITDGLLSAANCEDIGQLFPDTNPGHRNRDSAEMLRAAVSRVRQQGFHIINIDCVVQTEIPKIAVHKREMQARIASLLGIQADCVGLKGKTGEGVGEVGKGILAEATVVVLLEKTVRGVS